jgi:hypothetical protein
MGSLIVGAVVVGGGLVVVVVGGGLVVVVVGGGLVVVVGGGLVVVVVGGGLVVVVVLCGGLVVVVSGGLVVVVVLEAGGRAPEVVVVELFAGAVVVVPLGVVFEVLGTGMKGNEIVNGDVKIVGGGVEDWFVLVLVDSVLVDLLREVTLVEVDVDGEVEGGAGRTGSCDDELVVVVP